MAETGYRRTGRGGAGNFYSQKDIDEVTKSNTEDLEAQKPHHLPVDAPPTDPANVPEHPTTAPIASSSGNGTRIYARSGRGGAGNFVDPPVASTSSPTSPTHNSSSAAPHPSSPHKSQAPYLRGASSGRGGAGNWTTAGEEGEEKPYDREQERKRREALDAHILQDIRNSLPHPPKIHYMHGPGRGRKPDLLPA